MRVLHTSDWHLGMSFRGIDISQDQEYFINQICDIVRQEKVDALIIAGDIFDRSIASVDAIKMYDDAMLKFCRDMKLPVMIVAGNHDGAERLSSCNELLRSSGLYIAGVLEPECMRVEFDDAEFYLLPWFTTEKVKAIYPDVADDVTSLEAGYRLICDKIRERFTPGKRHILIAHSFIVGASTSTSDRTAEVGLATAVSADVFCDFDYVALGHIHEPQNISSGIRYSGTPMPYSFGREEKQEKSVTLIDTKDMSQKVIPLDLLHERNTIKGTYRELLEGNVSERVREGYVRLEITDIHVGLEIMAQLRTVYSNLLEVTSRGFESDETATTMTIEELEDHWDDPTSIFRQYYHDVIKQEPDQHFIQLFEEAVCAYELEED